MDRAHTNEVSHSQASQPVSAGFHTLNALVTSRGNNSSTETVR